MSAGIGADARVSRFERRAMGSPLRFALVGATDAEARRAWAIVDAEIEAAEEALSRYRETSDLTRANRAARREPGLAHWVEVDLRLRRALVAADRAGRRTDGRFDARVLADLERLGSVGVAQSATRTQEPADAAGIVDPRPSIDRHARWLWVDGRRPRVQLGTPVDLGGIGKGLALRWAWRRFHRATRPGIGAMLDAGGDVVVRGPSPDGGPWSIGIEDPRNEGEHVAVLAIEDGAVATSSVIVNRWRAPDGRLVHHLIDPATGEPGGLGLLAVTVAGPDPAWAEVWSKTLFLAGSAGIADAARSRGLAAWWVTVDGELSMTAAARMRTAWEPDPRRTRPPAPQVG
ncbi:MAG TPA: FAD:protein FMN transferase [Candidatus Limnocylindrales bacterium]